MSEPASKAAPEGSAGQIAGSQASGVSSRRALRYAIEIFLVFAVFCLQAPAKVPDSNEPHYLAKARHYWDPTWLPGDQFLDTADTHWTFYVAWGWLTRWLPQEQVAWSGRLVTWGLLAWGWTRLSWRVVPRPWVAPASAAMFAAVSDKVEMAGEWMIGGCEAKGFAFALVLFGLGSLVRGGWNRAWLLFGAASSFHVLVGGWSVVAGGIAWLAVGRRERPLGSMVWGLAGGAILSLPGVLPGLELARDVTPTESARANEIQVLSRLPHHLYLPWFSAASIQQHVMGVGLWGLLLAVAWQRRERERDGASPDARRRGRAMGRRGWRLHAFVAGTLAVTALGGAIALYVWFSARRAVGVEHPYPAWAVGLLKFYWFRLGDILLPTGAALMLARVAAAWPARGRSYALPLALLALVAVPHLGLKLKQRSYPPPAYREGSRDDFANWQDACGWVAQNTAKDATFLTPRLTTTFRWYAERADVGNYKDMPQDPKSLLAWWERILDLHYDAELKEFRGSLSEREPADLRRLGAKYGAAYLITEREPEVDLPVAYRNDSFVVYRLDGAP